LSFESPAALAGLVMVPVALAVYFAYQRRRVRYAVRFTNLDLLSNLVTGSPRWRRHLPPALLLLALTSLIVAVARPEATVKVPKDEASIMLATDASGSMEADDVEPNRLEAARRAAKTFSDGLPEDFRLGLAAFSESVTPVVPPTTDRDRVDAALDTLEPQRGTAIGDALQTSLQAIRPIEPEQPRDGRRRPPAVIVLLSDGENTVGTADPVDMAREARRQGIPINTVALGTDDGSIQRPGPLGPTTIPVPPNREALREIADESGGRFFEAPDADRLESIYENLSTRIGYNKEKREITAAFAGGGLVLLLAGGLLSLAWFGRLP
jgi:Ca-activated chloride channel homolog